MPHVYPAPAGAGYNCMDQGGGLSMAPPTKRAAERCAKDGRFSYPPDLQEKVAAYRRARKLSPLIQDAIRRAPWPLEK